MLNFNEWLEESLGKEYLEKHYFPVGLDVYKKLLSLGFKYTGDPINYENGGVFVILGNTFYISSPSKLSAVVYREDNIYHNKIPEEIADGILAKYSLSTNIKDVLTNAVRLAVNKLKSNINTKNGRITMKNVAEYFYDRGDEELSIVRKQLGSYDDNI